MKKARRKIEELLWITGLHTPARLLYRATQGRGRQKVHDLMSRFFRTLIPPDALVFDIGANVGLFAEVFSSLGARVIAVEPISDCVRHIQLAYPNERIKVIQAVVGPQNGLATLKISNEKDNTSSVSDEWIAAVVPGTAKARVAVSLPMITLDTLAEHFGMPHFIKIDVEGFEESVLDGLSVQPPLMTFEFNLKFMEAAMRCLDKRLFAEESTYNFVLGDPTRFELESWVGRAQIQEILSNLKKGDPSGGGQDIFIRRPPAPGSPAPL